LTFPHARSPLITFVQDRSDATTPLHPKRKYRFM
jgi:hypothetical protein